MWMNEVNRRVIAQRVAVKFERSEYDRMYTSAYAQPLTALVVQEIVRMTIDEILEPPVQAISKDSLLLRAIDWVASTPTGENMKLQDIIQKPTSVLLLKLNGESDALHGIDRHKGWDEICEQAGYSNCMRSPAQNAYEDGWNSIPAKLRGSLKEA